MAASSLMPAHINTVSASSCLACPKHSSSLARPNYSSLLSRSNPHSSCTRTSDDRAFINVSNGSRVHCMQVVNPFENKRFETLSYVPRLSSEQIAKQIDSIVSKGWIPCLEFDKRGEVFRENSRRCGYYDGRYWTMWKLPMFGCHDPAAVLREVEECKATYPDAYIRMMAYDSKRQVQCVAFLVHRPSST